MVTGEVHCTDTNHWNESSCCHRELIFHRNVLLRSEFASRSLVLLQRALCQSIFGELHGSEKEQKECFLNGSVISAFQLSVQQRATSCVRRNQWKPQPRRRRYDLPGLERHTLRTYYWRNWDRPDDSGCAFKYCNYLSCWRYSSTLNLFLAPWFTSRGETYLLDYQGVREGPRPSTDFPDFMWWVYIVR